MGEGGAVLTDKLNLQVLIDSYRDWGRDCWCEPGKDNTCGKRFGWQLGSLPCGYDHKYTYSHIGYNLKATDMQAALGCRRSRNSLTYRAAQGELRLPEGGAEAAGGVPDAARCERGIGPELVWISYRSKARRTVYARRADRGAGGAEDRDAG